MGKKSDHRLDDSETERKSKKKIQKVSFSFSMGKNSFKSNHRLDDSDTKRKSKKKIQKEKYSEKKLSKMLLPRYYSLKDIKTPTEVFKCCFSVPEAAGANWGNSGESIFVTGFDSSLTRDCIKNALRQHFGSCGQASRVFVPVECETGARLGFACIDLENYKDIKKALRLDGSELGGRKLEVAMLRDREAFFDYPYPNFKGCDTCRIRDQISRSVRIFHATRGGRIISRDFLSR